MNRKLVAIVAALPIVLGAVLGATPALADTGDSAAPVVDAIPAPAATPTPEPAATAPVPDDSPSPVATATPAPEVTPTPEPSAPAPQPSAAPVPVPSSTATPAPLARAPAAQIPAPAAAPQHLAAKASASVVHVGSQETGYTYCWDLYPDQPNIDPYDARTWPAGNTCFPQQDQRATWTSTATFTNTQTGASAQASYSGTDVTFNGPLPAALHVEPGQSVHATYDFAVTVPTIDTRPVIGSDGNPMALTTPTINLRSLASNPAFVQDPTPFGITSNTSSCDQITVTDVQGPQHYSCSLDLAVSPDFQFQDWNKVKGTQIVTQLSSPFEMQWVYNGSPGPWSSAGTASAPAPIHVDPAQTWLPAATDKTFRVKAADTLTVTPSGLLVGASWTQGNVSALNTYITNVPAGGTVTPTGDLSFTSQQVGDYGFNYYLQDPATGVRSANATGAIEVYSDAAPTYSCFAGMPAPQGTDYTDLPGDPGPVEFTGKVGDEITFTTKDLVGGTAWVNAYLRDGSALPGLAGTGPLDDQVFEWTPKDAGSYTFTYSLGTLNCASKLYAATVVVSPADAAVTPTPPSPPTIIPPLLPAAPIPAAPAPVVQALPQPVVLAHTGSSLDINGTALLGLGLAALGVIVLSRAAYRRRLRPAAAPSTYRSEGE